MRGLIADQIGAAARDDLPPVAGIFLELGFFGGINVVANNAGQHDVVRG